MHYIIQLIDQDSSFEDVPLYKLNTYSLFFFYRGIIYTINWNGSFQVTPAYQVIVHLE